MKIILKISALAILLTCIFTSAQCQRRMRKGNLKPFTNTRQIDQYLQKLTKEQKFSGTVLMVQNNHQTFGKAYGYASKNFKIPNRLDTKFNIGSMNKIFTQVAILQLFEKGKLLLEDKAIKYVPELSMQHREKITLRHLLQMKSGLGFYWGNPNYTQHWFELRNMEDYLDIIKDEKLAFEPGTSRQYSNSGYELLGIIIQRVSKQNYHEYIRENIYKAADMRNTDSYDYDEVVENLAMGYTNLKRGETMTRENRGSGTGYTLTNVYRHSSKGTAAGGGYATVGDFWKFGKALTAKKLLNRQSLDLLYTRFARKAPKKIAQRFFIAGGSVGISAAFAFDADKGNAVMVFANYDAVSMPVAMRLEKSLTTLSK